MSLKQLFCKHENACYPVFDSSKWEVGFVCDKCHKYFPREDMPNYEGRAREHMQLMEGMNQLWKKIERDDT